MATSIAGVFDLTVAARSVVDDDYAYEVWQMANRYPAQKPAGNLLETIDQYRRRGLAQHQEAAASPPAAASQAAPGSTKL